MKTDYHRCYAEVSLKAIGHNIEEVKKRIDGDVRLMVVIKADAYGHGAIRVGRYLSDRVDYFAVATVSEGIALREAGITTPILILGYTAKCQFKDVIEYDITQTIDTYDAAKSLDEAAGAAGKKARVHLAIDTGMTRIGFQTTDIDEMVKTGELPNLYIEGAFTHFAAADETDKTYTTQQAERFKQVISTLAEKGIEIPICHIANSAGIMDFSEYRLSMVRAGIVTYGLYPSEEVKKQNMELIPALTWKAHVIHVKDVESGVPVSYGCTYVTTREKTKIATLSVGYADGYPRALSNKGRVLIHGSYAPIIGRVCMDQLMVDVTGIEDVHVEDTAILAGADGENRISIEELANGSCRLNYEMLCNISSRVERIYS